MRIKLPITSIKSVIEIIASLNHVGVSTAHIRRATPECIVPVHYAGELSLADGVGDSDEGGVGEAGVFGAVGIVEVGVAGGGGDGAGKAGGAYCSV
jgi:hypothetical protein